MKPLTLLIIILFFSGSCYCQAIAAPGMWRALPPDLWGVAGQNTIRNNINWQTKPLLDKLIQLHPTLLRYPGGSIANWWDWREGWFVQSEYFPKDLGKLTRGPDKPEDFKRAVDLTGATPVWTLNMITSDLQEQLAMLHYVKSLGMTVTLVELGSEFYLDGNEYIRNKYPAGVDYALECNRWRDSIKKHFPEAKCAYLGVMTKGNKANRRNEWNESLASVAINPDAITLHVYPQQSMPNATAEQKGDPVEILSEPFRAMDRIMKKDLAAFAGVSEIWITEYNMNNNTAPVQGTWLHGLYVALISMKFLEDLRITHCIYFTMCGKAGYGAIFTDDNGFGFGSGPKKEFVPPPDPPKTTPWSFSAAGYTMSRYGEAVKGKEKATLISFKNVPQLKCGTDGFSYPALYGWKFTAGASQEIIILNLSSLSISCDVQGICSPESRYIQSSAEAYTYVAKGNEMKTEEGVVSNSLALKPFSLTLIKEK
ncbi:MAG: hypothetical protein ABIQ74_01585 [Chitinophagales bacterium]